VGNPAPVPYALALCERAADKEVFAFIIAINYTEEYDEKRNVYKIRNNEYFPLCPPALLPTLDLLLSDSNFEEFLLEVMTYIYSLKYGESSESVDLISHKLNQAGSSFAPPEIISRLLPRLQLLSVINALERVLSSMKEVKSDKADHDPSK